MSHDSAPPIVPLQSQPVHNNSNTLKIVLIVLAVILGIMMLICGILAVLLIPAVSAARTAAKSVQTMNNLKQIGLAMHNYQSAYKSLPSAYSINHAKQPMFSWRVAILPYIEQGQLYQRINFNKPWDADENKFLLDQMPTVFRSALANESLPKGHTTVFTLRDPSSMFKPGSDYAAGVHYSNFSSVSDGLSNTLMVIDLPNHPGVPWTKPDDVTPSEAYVLLSQLKGHGGANLCLGDGSVKRQPPEITEEDFNALVSAAGNEQLPPNMFDMSR
jgi:type II secretory pathway pseudopilin PulG